MNIAFILWPFIVNIIVIIAEVIHKDNNGSDIYCRPYKINLTEYKERKIHLKSHPLINAQENDNPITTTKQGYPRTRLRMQSPHHSLGGRKSFPKPPCPTPA